ncbi:hypothetical protein [Pseudobacteriovorax antillogorgiicola]|uniref:Endonuclease/Exonuclease/phosphatase family protein n=1 Tax=Pseudobacteriovorax antillogorgiicola TaxID=1513793 RepID=A0A1Y6CNQ8_9BACT|nr:hypothetical protein [Pseudobacteriovorax antillogorgiicola]TCS46966.1 hypothetical protein EDD56_12261 [Pseudobacteriovorax antillogorgiicola]SMF64633.1 hypothetical protein SAMN06296036_12261 [Pseudobacteriovorax antillogorgiicola]
MKSFFLIMLAIIAQHPNELNAESRCAKEGRITLLSYNIRHDEHWSDLTNHWRFRRADVASLISRTSADVVGLHDASAEQLAYLADALPEYARISEQSSFLVKTVERSVIKILEDQVSLAVRKDHYTPLYVTFDTSFAQQAPHTLVLSSLAGNLHSDSVHHALKAWEEAGLLPSWKILGKRQPDSTVNQWWGLKRHQSRVLDFVLSNHPGLVQESQVITEKVSGRYPSNRFPLRVEVCLLPMQDRLAKDMALDDREG